jgi:hypothetical protein
VFRTRYQQFEYRVIPFGLTNSPGTVRPSYKRNRGDKSSVEQRPRKRGMTLWEPKSSYTMTLPEVPERRTRVHVTTVKSCGDKCTQRAGISVPEESTYVPSIRKMISPPRDITGKARRDVERSTQCMSKYERSPITKQVEP